MDKVTHAGRLPGRRVDPALEWAAAVSSSKK
jgi:hypothetical protein